MNFSEEEKQKILEIGTLLDKQSDLREEILKLITGMRDARKDLKSWEPMLQILRHMQVESFAHGGIVKSLRYVSDVAGIKNIGGYDICHRIT